MPVQRWSEDTLVVQLADDPQLSEDMAEINDRLHAGCCDVVLDLSSLTLLTSSGISRLLRLRKRLIEAQRRLFICSVPDRVWTVFLATGLDAIFVFARNISEALAQLQSQKA